MATIHYMVGGSRAPQPGHINPPFTMGTLPSMADLPLMVGGSRVPQPSLIDAKAPLDSQSSLDTSPPCYLAIILHKTKLRRRFNFHYFLLEYFILTYLLLIHLGTTLLN